MSKRKNWDVEERGINTQVFDEVRIALKVMMNTVMEMEDDLGIDMDDPMEGGIIKTVVGLSESALEVSRQTCEAINVLMDQNKKLMRKVDALEARMN